MKKDRAREHQQETMQTAIEAALSSSSGWHRVLEWV